jgi:DNA polymerase-3 subunit alpha
MSAVKNVGVGAVEEIIRARADGPYETLEDFFSRVNTRLVNRKVLESLVKSGAMDRFGDRSQLLSNLDLMLAYGTKIQKEALSGQTDLFGNVVEESVLKPQITLMPPEVIHTDRERLQWERELMGLYLSRHPLSSYEGYLEERTHKTTELKPEHDNAPVVIGGIITQMREITTKNGQKMAFVTIADKFGEIEGIVFPRTHEVINALLKPDLIVLTEGKLSSRDRNGEISSEVKVIVDTMREITNEEITNFEPLGRKLKPPKPRSGKAKSLASAAASTSTTASQSKIYVRLKDTSSSEILMQLKSIIDTYSGENEVILVVGPDASKQAIRLPHRAVTTEDCLTALKNVVGEKSVVVAAQ